MSNDISCIPYEIDKVGKIKLSCNLYYISTGREKSGEYKNSKNKTN